MQKADQYAQFKGIRGLAIYRTSVKKIEHE